MTQVSNYITELKEHLDKLSGEKIEELGQKVFNTKESGNTIFVVGNGGSAATASHFVCDIQKTVLGKMPREVKGKRFRVICLNDNVPLLTAWANDVSYDDVFSESLKNLAMPGDLLIVITGSGNSPNILSCINTAKSLGVTTFGFLGFSGGEAKKTLDDCIVIESQSYGIIEDVHMVLVHILTEILKKSMHND
jgi:D-sedoheptulose 7-phosphate isomerase